MTTQIKMTTEAIQDLFTPGVCPKHECTKGLSKDAELVNVTMNHLGIVTFVFADGKGAEVTNVSLEFSTEADEEEG